MERNLIVITREDRAERPPMAQLLSDSSAMNQGQPPQQDPTKDNFFIATGDITKIIVRYLAQNDLNPYGIAPGDGLAVYSMNTRATMGLLRPGSKARLVIGDEVKDFDRIDTARGYLAGLPDKSAGYQILDLEQPEGSAKTIVIEELPSLTPQYDQAGGYILNVDVDLSIKVSHLNRVNDADRY